MIVAVPMKDGQFSPHFGGADQFAFVTVDKSGRQAPRLEVAPAPEHTRGAFPAWLRQRGAGAVIAGGMGGRAVDMFRQYGIDVVLGVESGDPVALAVDFVAGRLVGSDSRCEGGRLHHCDHHADKAP